MMSMGFFQPYNKASGSCLWENHSWNPGTRLIMNCVAFDHNAIMLS